MKKRTFIWIGAMAVSLLTACSQVSEPTAAPAPAEENSSNTNGGEQAADTSSPLNVSGEIVVW